MDLVNKYADKIPGVSKEDILKKIPGYGEPGLFEETIAALKETVKCAGHEKISKKYPDESSGIVSVGEAILTLMGETNRFTYFLKDNHEVTGALEEGNSIVTELNKVLKKIIGLNCITTICLLVKLVQKMREYAKQLEEYKKKVEEFTEMAKKEASKWIEKEVMGKAGAAVKELGGKALAVVSDAIGKIW